MSLLDRLEEIERTQVAMANGDDRASALFGSYGLGLVASLKKVFREELGGQPVLTDGARAIAVERDRQREKLGWTEEHDDDHDGGQLALAAACYAAASANTPILSAAVSNAGTYYFRDPFPWDFDDDSRPRDDDRALVKPTDEEALRLLAKAGALIAAEIDRRLRAARKRAGEATAAPR